MRPRLRGALAFWPRAVEHGLLSPWRRRPVRPLALCLYVTYRCQMRCGMCGIWRGRPGAELPPAGFERILADPFFARLEALNLNGGEPNLRPDLSEIADRLLRLRPRIRRLSLNTNGLPGDRMRANAAALALVCRSRGTELSISVSLHGLGRDGDRIAGIPGATKRILESLRVLKEIRRSDRFRLSVNCVVTRLNVRTLDDVRSWGLAEDVPVNYTLGEVRGRFLNDDQAGDVLLRGEERRLAARFFEARAREKRLHRQHAVRYRELARMLAGGARRSLACYYALCGAILDAEGRLYYCKNSAALGSCAESPAARLAFDPASVRRRSDVLLRTACPACPPNTYNEIEVQRDILKVAWGLVRP